MTARSIAIAAGVLVAACHGPKVLQSPVRTVALPAPDQGEPAFEPSIAIDPDHPDHVVIGAQYGVGYNRGGRKIWSWESVDGGRTWEGAEIPLPNSEATLAADVVTAFGVDGRPWIAFLYADSRFHGGLAIARGRSGTTGFDPARLVVADRMDQGQGAVDKPWIAIDRGATSPLRGTVYLNWHLNRPLANHTVASTLWIGSSRDGLAWTEPLVLAEEFGGQVAARSDGTLDVVFGDRGERGIYHRSSPDGARSFGSVDTVRRVQPPFSLDLPTVAATAAGTIAYCVPVDSAAVLERRRVECAAGSELAGWGRPMPLDTGRTTALPALAADRAGVWALAYRSDSSRTEVVLYRSTDGGRTYREQAVLAHRPFGIAHACLAPGGSCRRATREEGMFFPGDYVGLAAAPGRLAAAFVLPDSDRPTGRPTVYVSVVDLDRWPAR